MILSGTANTKDDGEILRIVTKQKDLQKITTQGSINSGNRGVENTNKILIIVISKHYTFSFIIQLTCKQHAFAIFTR